MDNRALSNIKTGMEKGENTFFLYGKYIHDWFMNDMYAGIQTLKETLRHYFVDELNFEAFFYCRTNEFLAFTRKSGKLPDKKYFEGRVDENDDLFGMDSSNADLSDEQKKKSKEVADSAASTQGEDAWLVAYNKAIAKVKQNPKKRYAFFFEDFEWTSALYKSSNDNELLYIERLFELGQRNNAVSVVSISDVKLLERYSVDPKSKNVEMLGSPSVDEIYSAYTRKFFRKYKESQDVSLENIAELREISTAIGSGEKSLKECMRIFNQVMKLNNGVICKKDFENAIDKAIGEKVSLEDVVLSDDKKADIVGRVEKFLKADSKEITKITKGLILTGPPGTGKTFLVKAIANEKNCYFMSPSLGDLKGEYVGHTSANVKRLFQQARANSPTIIFIDEADSFFPTRGGLNTDSFAEDMVNQFLVEMDGVSTGTSKVFVVAATNRIDLLDSAVKSRLGSAPIEIPLPGKLERKEIFRKHLAEKGVEHFVGYQFFNDEFLAKTDQFSGRDIKNFVGNMETEAEKQTKTLADFEDVASIRDLFFRALHLFEDNLIARLSNSFHIEVKRPDRIEANYDDVIGCYNVKASMTRQIRFFNAGELSRAEKFGVVPKRGILLYGPPGNAKSQIAEATAKQHNLLLMKITNDMFSKNSPSDQSHALVEIFNGAVQLSKLCTRQNGVLLFFDEFDTLGNSGNLDIRATMLKQLDNTDTMRNKHTKVLFVAATNYIEQIDEAMKRPGRIDEKIRMTNPSKTEGAEILKKMCESRRGVASIDNQMAEYAYTRLHESKVDVESAKMYKVSQMTGRSIDYDNINPDMEAFRPSGADIKNFVQSLVEYAYDNDCLTEDESSLLITKKVVDSCNVEFL